MKGKVKIFQNNKWELLPIEKLVGTSVLRYMTETEDRVVAGLIENDKPIAFIVNNEEDFNIYGKKGACFYANNLYTFLEGIEIVPKVVYNVFPDSTFEVLEANKQGDIHEEHHANNNGKLRDATNNIM